MNHFARIIKPDGSVRTVKNLGWLIRNWQGTELITFDYAPDRKSRIDGTLSAQVGDWLYESSYSCLSVCWNWLNRPIFKGVPFQLKTANGVRSFVIGNDEWKAINRLPYAEQMAALEVQP